MLFVSFSRDNLNVNISSKTNRKTLLGVKCFILIPIMGQEVILSENCSPILSYLTRTWMKNAWGWKFRCDDVPFYFICQFLIKSLLYRASSHLMLKIHAPLNREITSILHFQNCINFRATISIQKTFQRTFPVCIKIFRFWFRFKLVVLQG